MIAMLLAIATVAPSIGQAAAGPDAAAGVISFEGGSRLEDPEHVPSSPAWQVFRWNGLMRLRLQQQGQEWVDAGSTYSLIAFEEKAPYWGEASCEVINQITAAERSGPLRPTEDNIRLVLDRAAGTAELSLQMGTVPGRLGWAAELHGDCQVTDLAGRHVETTTNDSIGWGVFVRCPDGRLDPSGITIRFERSRCINIYRDKLSDGRTELGGSFLQGRIRLTP
jgi:hypothetical protein